MADRTTEEIKYDSIVVGGGIAGLTSAVYLARAGQKVLLVEKNAELGGLVSSFSRNGFHYEAGVRALEDAGIIFPMLHDLGIELDVVKSPVSIGIETDIIKVETVEDIEKYRQLLVKYFPSESKEIDSLIKIIHKIMKHMDVLYGIENPVFKDLKRDHDFFLKKLLPWLPKFLFTVGKINAMNQPIDEYLAKIISNPSLRDMIAQHFFKNTPAFFALSYFSLYLDYFYPKKGVGQLTEALKHKILELGGEIITETRIQKVETEHNLLIDQNKHTYHYQNLIWAADLKTLYRNISTEKLPTKSKLEFEKTKTKTLSSRGTDSVFSLFLEIDVPLDQFKSIAHGHFFYTPCKSGLGETHRKELDALLLNFENTGKEDVYRWLNKFTQLNTYEISIPGIKNPELTPPGKTGMIISLLVEYDLFKKAQNAGWLNELVTELETQMINVIGGSVYPMIKDKITGRFSFSPISIENRVGSSEGAIVGWAFKESMPVVNKIQFSDRSVLTPIPNIYQAGQWAYSPAGVPMSILTGKLAADRVIKAQKKGLQ